MYSQAADDTLKWLQENLDKLDEVDGPVEQQSMVARESAQVEESESDRLLILEATVQNLQARSATKENQIQQLQRELSEARRAPPTTPKNRQSDAVVMADRLQFVEHEKSSALEREKALLRERDDLRKQLAAAKEAVVPLRPAKRHKEEHAPSVSVPSVPVPPVPPPPPAPLPAVSPVTFATPLAPPVDYHKELIKKLYAGDDIFQLLQLQETDNGEEKEELLGVTRELAMKISMMFASNSGADGLAYSLALFLCASRDRILLRALGVLNTVFSTVPETRKRMQQVMEEPLTAEPNEDEPWRFLLGVLVGQVGPSLNSKDEDALALLLQTFHMLAQDSSSQQMEIFVPLISPSSDFVPSLLHNHSGSVTLRVHGLNFLALLVKSPEVYRHLKMSRSDGTSLLSLAAIFFIKSVGSKDETKLRRAVVNLFSIVVASHSDWDSCTADSSNGSGSGGKWANDFGPRIVTLLFESIQQLKLVSSIEPERARLIWETFGLLEQCAKNDLVEASLLGRSFRQIYISSLVALSTTPALHPSLISLQAPSAAMLARAT